jgi:hypothetical protein
VASLQGSLDQVSQLEPRLAAVADLRGAMQALSALRTPLEQVGVLVGPMSRLTALIDRPVVLLLIAVAALSAWGGVTYFAVRLAIVSAQRTRPDHA